MKVSTRMVYVGTYTAGKSQGIYRCRLDVDTGALDLEGLVAESEDPSFLVIHPGKRFLYAVNELMVFDGKPGGAVSAFAIDPTGTLLLVANQHSDTSPFVSTSKRARRQPRGIVLTCLPRCV